MKKLTLCIFLVLILFVNNARSELIELNNCFQIKDSLRSNSDNFIKTTKYVKSDWSVNSSSGLITHIEIYTDEFLNNINKEFVNKLDPIKKENFTDYELTNFTSNIIIGKKYITNPSLRELLIYPNEKAVLWEVRIDTNSSIAKVIMMPNGSDIFDYNKFKKLFNGNLTYSDFRKMHKTEYKTFKCEKSISDTDKTGTSSGTAFFINDKGNLITNNHVVEGCKLPKINYFNKEYETSLISIDKTLDLALLKVDLKPRAFISFSNKEPKKRELVIVAGYPLGQFLSDDLKINEGKVSSLKGFENNSNEITVDLAINPGNSGGPIVNENGQLVAVAVAGMSKDITEGISFGIKSSAVTNFLKTNKISPNIKITSFSMNDEKVNQLLEESTVYIFCD